ncbi:phosphodiester glycosidase family protein [Phytoactinopolyspora mesophila]|uniref:Phosphodiester glycosidase domain-containing protein n=1 Tax=Phytoactinopolyspora mesophila TaxID=2650750 RepID=A0A7K3M8D5_9ACTN|nr:phosphodiester glycosidase family protein [Phytoactinopolyspora mesophila]NDL59523.1 hypothetical protein [Phytoactinopolyspora mesophila]
MSIRKKAGRLQVIIAAVLLAVGALVLPASAEPVVAQQENPCTPNQSNFLPSWQTVYDDRGVTLCLGSFAPTEPLPVEAYLQIIDLEAGAKLRLVKECAEPCISDDHPYNTEVQFNKRTAQGWFDWIGGNVSIPSPNSLFSVANASFLVDTSADTTALSLPHIHNIINEPTQIAALPTAGWAFKHNDDYAWDALKRALMIGDARATSQDVWIEEFATHYTESDLIPIYSNSRGDATVGFQPLYGVVDPEARRTFVGVVPGSKVFILSTRAQLTLEEANGIVQSFGSSMAIQLDGGASTQMQFETPDGQSGGIESSIPVFPREVPDVLAVYLAP